MNLMPLADLLEGESVGVRGESIFLNMMPAEAESAILLRNPLSGARINYEMPGYFRTEFQLIVRGHSYAETETLMNRVIAILTLNETQVEDAYFKFSRPKTEPVAYPLSKGNLIEFNAMFEVTYVKAP